jgi:hypothetical protein
MNPEHELTRALTQHLITTRPFHLLIPDDATAISLFMAVAHESRCPLCRGEHWEATVDHHIHCCACGEVNIHRRSGWWRRHLPTRTLLAAVFGVCVDAGTPTARGFARAEDIRAETSWRLLHAIRASLPRVAPAEPGFEGPVLGGDAAENAADAVVTFCDDRLVVVSPDDAVPAAGHRAVAPVWHGQLRAWLTAVFRGVSKRHLWKYLAEFAARFGRVARGGVPHVVAVAIVV